MRTKKQRDKQRARTLRKKLARWDATVGMPGIVELTLLGESYEAKQFLDKGLIQRYNQREYLARRIEHARWKLTMMPA